MKGQMSIFDYPEYLPDEFKKGDCKDKLICGAYPDGCGGTIWPCRFGGPFKWVNTLQERNKNGKS